MSPLPGAETAEFNVHLVNFTGPFDLLLQLISKHKLDVTEVALSQVTDDFVAHIKLATATTAPAGGTSTSRAPSSSSQRRCST